MKITEAIEAAQKIERVSDQEIAILPVRSELEISQRFQVGVRSVQEKALELEIMPARYLRNYGTAGLEGQKKLLKARVGIIGVGGLGGWQVELLARMGVGELVVIDYDVFSDNNLNRQLFSREANLGRSKVDAARERVQAINGGVAFWGAKEALTRDNAVQLLAGCQVICDGLDNLSSRLLLQETASRLKIPLIHGAIGGYYGQVLTIFPGDPGLENLYPINQDQIKEQWSEQEMGNPAATPAMVASWQVQETIKIILGQGEPLRNRLLFFDARQGLIETINLVAE